MPQVSVIMAAYNSARTIKKAIDSVRGQTEQDFEILVVDDASADGTYELVATLAAEDPRIRLFRLSENKGPGAARNFAIDRATGDWLTILDADDWYEPRRLEALMRAGQEYKADLVGNNLKIFDHAVGEIVERTMYGRPDRVVPLTAETFFARDNPLVRHAMGYMQPMIRRAFVVDRGIRYDESHRAGEDFIFISENLLQGARAIIVPGSYYVYVHRISPTTRRRSPDSRSEAGHRLIVRGCDELLAKYGPTMPEGARRALQRRHWIFESRVRCGDMLDDLRSGHPFAAVRVLFTRPFILVLIVNTIAKTIYANILNSRRRMGIGG
ncbi:MAG TPA: glycosyltransferase family 2 protein [Alphaproteobacteria bacterium]|nr:glycosyltransferase family 2 protein [Alphaproteobacteria bacterium]